MIRPEGRKGSITCLISPPPLRAASPRTAGLDTRQRTYVLDTSVLLSDPGAIHRFAEHAVVIPVIVIAELEKKRHDPEIGYFARKALRNLDDLRIAHERLDFPVPTEGGGSCASS